MKKNINNLSVFYICKDYTDELLLSINNLLLLGIKVTVFNIYDEVFPINEVEIINSNIENLKKDIILNKNKLKKQFLLILDDTETLFISDEFDIDKLKDKAFNIEIYPDKDKVFNYEIEVFKSKEIRLFDLRNKNSEEFIFIDYSLNTISNKYIHILKKEYKLDIDLLKLSDKDSLFKGIFYFYNNSIKAEEYLSLEENSNISKLTLLKLYLLQNNIEKAKELADNNYNLLEKISTFHFYLAEINFREKKYKEVISSINKGFKLKNIIEPYIISDNNWKPYLLLGKSLFYLFKYNSSKNFLEKIEELIIDRKSEEALFYLIKVYFQLKEYDKSINYIESILNIDKLNKFIINELKYLFFNLLLYIDIDEKVIKLLENEIFKDEYSILVTADTLYMNEDYEKALQIYLFVKENSSDENKELIFKIAIVCARLKLLKESAQFFEKYLEYEPNNLDILNNLAFIYLNLELLDKSEYICKKLLEINNFSFEAYLYLSLIYLSKEDKIKSKFYIDKAKTINPISPEIIKLFQIFKSTFNG